MLKAVPIKDDTYTDIKPGRDALGTAYLAILDAVNEYLVGKKGFLKKELPKSVDEYRIMIKKHISHAGHNGRLLREFESLYDALHIAGYYRGLIYNTDAVKVYLKAVRTFIEKIG